MVYNPHARLREARLLTPAQTAQILKVSTSTLQRWRNKDNDGPRYLIVGKRPRYAPADVQRYIEEQRAKSKR